MIQVWILDKNGFYTGEVDFVEEPKENEITKPYEVGYIKGKWDFEIQDWVEGATEEEIVEWEDSKQIDICPEPTTEEKVTDLINQVTVMDEIIASLTLEVL